MAFNHPGSLVRSSQNQVALPAVLNDLSVEHLAWDALALALFLTVWFVCRLSVSWRKGGLKETSHQKHKLDTAYFSAARREPAKPPLTLPSGAAQAILRASDRQCGRALELYQKFQGRIDWSSVSNDDAQKAFRGLCMAAVRDGKVDVLERLLLEMQSLSVPRTSDLYTLLLKMAASKHLFKEALALWRCICADEVQLLDRAAWSCLLFAATEMRSAELAFLFFEKLSACGQPSDRDFGNLIRLRVGRHEASEAFSLIQKMRAEGLEPDIFTYNAVLSSCCAGGTRLDLAEQLFSKMKSIDGCVDIITCNTLIKGYAHAKRVNDAFDVVAEMESSGLTPTQVTLGTLLDLCVNEGCMDHAHIILRKIRQSGCQMNTVLYTTLIKGFVKSREVDKVLQVYDTMCQHVKPDTITFSLVLKALCDARRMEEALVFFEKICADGHRPDDIMFNNLLAGCIVCKNMSLGEKLVDDMLSLNIKPSCATFSILLKLYADQKAAPRALEMLKAMETTYGVQPEQRLYIQLIHACFRMRQWHFGLDAFNAMIAQHGTPSQAETAALLRACISFNLFDAAVQLCSLALESGGQVRIEQMQDIVDAAKKKRRPLVISAVADLANRHGLKL